MTDNDCEAFEAEKLLLKMSEMYFSGKNKILCPDFCASWISVKRVGKK